MRPNVARDPLELEPTCPAASRLSGPPVHGPAIICNAMRIAKDSEEESQEARDGRAEVVLYARSDRGMGGDPESVAMLCCGEYRRCPIWRAERQREWTGIDRLLDPEKAREEEADGRDPEDQVREFIEDALAWTDGPWTDAVRDPSLCECGAEVVLTPENVLACPTGLKGHRGIRSAREEEQVRWVT